MNEDNRGNTLRLNPNERERTGSRHSTSDRRPTSGNRNGDRKPQAPKGHDAQLKDAQDNGKPVVVVLMHGETIKGNVANRDRYTVTIRTESRYVIYYKHAIESIEVIQPTAVAS